MEFIDYIALVGLFISGWVYIALANEEKQKGVDSFFYNSHTTKSNRYGTSMAAASTSLATVVLFFITGVGHFGVFLLWCGVSYFAGQVLLLWTIKSAKIETSQLTTVSDFWSDVTSTSVTPKIFTLLTATSFVFMLFLELYIGSQILTFFFDSKDSIITFFCFILLLLLVAVYVLRGGMHAVFKSDLWQYTLMVIAVLVIGFCTLIYTSETEVLVDLTSLATLEIDNFELILFLIWVTIQNLTLPFTQLSSWQRLASMKNVDCAISGLKKIAIGFIILWLAPVVALLVLKSSGLQFGNIEDFFNFFRDSENIFIYFSFALIFIGFSSALFSTADSAFIATLLAFTDKNTFLKTVERKNKGEITRILTIFVLTLVAVESLLFYVFEVQVGNAYLSVVYVIFSQLSLIAPHMIIVMYRKLRGLPNLILSKVQDATIACSLILCWTLLFYLNFYGLDWGLNQNNSVIVGSLLGMLFSGGALAFSITVQAQQITLEK